MRAQELDDLYQTLQSLPVFDFCGKEDLKNMLERQLEHEKHKEEKQTMIHQMTTISAAVPHLLSMKINEMVDAINVLKSQDCSPRETKTDFAWAVRAMVNNEIVRRYAWRESAVLISEYDPRSQAQVLQLATRDFDHNLIAAGTLLTLEDVSATDWETTTR